MAAKQPRSRLALRAWARNDDHKAAEIEALVNVGKGGGGQAGTSASSGRARRRQAGKNFTGALFKQAVRQLPAQGFGFECLAANRVAQQARPVRQRYKALERERVTNHPRVTAQRYIATAGQSAAQGALRIHCRRGFVACKRRQPVADLRARGEIFDAQRTLRNGGQKLRNVEGGTNAALEPETPQDSGSKNDRIVFAIV